MDNCAERSRTTWIIVQKGAGKHGLFLDKICHPPLNTYLHIQISIENVIYHQNTDYILSMNKKRLPFI